MTASSLTAQQLMTLLQLASPALPVGAYSYSEGIETLSSQGAIANSTDLLSWLTAELQWGGIRLEAAIMQRAYMAAHRQQSKTIEYWNQWLSAWRETAEMRSQSWQMGRSLLRLFADLEPDLAPQLPSFLEEENCNFAIAYALITQIWKIPLAEATLIYLHSWAANLISAAVRAVPLGQTEGQRLLRQLMPVLETAQLQIQSLTTADLMACSWGPTLASMQHETLYSRLFRS